MARFLVRTAALSICLTTLAAVPVAAKAIPPGIDYWVTRPNSTTFKFPDKDVESLCHATPSSTWDHKVALQGIPAWGSDWDSGVIRLIPAIFDPHGNALTKVQFKELNMISTAPTDTPCGKLNWLVRLAKKGLQPITKMKITKTSEKGGVFHADLALRVELQANRADTGRFVGSLFYDIKLADPQDGTPWSFGAQGAFRPGMKEDNSCIDVLREKLGTFPAGSNHIYYVSNLIAQGQCREQK